MNLVIEFNINEFTRSTITKTNTVHKCGQFLRDLKPHLYPAICAVSHQKRDEIESP